MRKFVNVQTINFGAVESALGLDVVRAACLVLSICLAGCAMGVTDPTDPLSLPPAGTVMAESFTDIGQGYREVRRSVVNPPDAFEGVGHFSFVYFGDQRLCQCDARAVRISPDGVHAIYAREDGILMLFNARARSLKALADQDVGAPAQVSWTKARANVVLVERQGAQGSRNTLSVELEDVR